VTALERRYARLLAAYPPEHRQHHGTEILDTLLLAASPGQRWPSAREAVALVVGGLRVRAARAPRTPAGLCADGLRLAVVVSFAESAGGMGGVWAAASPLGQWLGQRVDGGMLPPMGVAIALALLAVVRGRMRTAMGLVLLAYAVSAWNVVRIGLPASDVLLPAAWLVPAAVAALAWLPALRSARRPWSWHLVWVAALFAFPPAVIHLVPPGVALLPWPVVMALVLPVAVLLAVAIVAAEPRAALAAGIVVAVSLAGYVQALFTVASLQPDPSRLVTATVATLLVGLACAATTVLTARRSRGQVTGRPGSSPTHPD
jgi:hypothetical protein